MITRRGAGIIAVSVAVFFLASTTRVGWVHLAGAVMWGVVLLSLAVPWVSMPGLRLERSVHRKESGNNLGPIEGDDLPVTMKLQNRWWLPRFLVSISYPVTVAGIQNENRGIFFWTWPRKTSVSDKPLKLERRGQHSLGDSLIEITGPFGMFRRRRRIAMSHGVLAYPMWKPMSRLGLMESQAGEQEGRRKSRTGVDASGTRAYVPGDSYRSIHWRNSARSGRLAVREFDTWNDKAVAFAIDSVNVVGESPDSSLDDAIRVAGSCARVIEREGGTVSVLTATGESPEFMAWPGVMEHLARLDPQSPGSGSLAQRIAGLQSGKRLMAFLSSGSTDEAAAVSAAAQRGIACVAVMFTDAESTESREATGFGSLQLAGVPVVHCGPGQLDKVLAEIESGVGRASFGSGGANVTRQPAPGIEKGIAA